MNTTRPTSTPTPYLHPVIFAHRGAMAYRPQNTLPSFQLAWEMGARAIELDVQCTREGEVVVFHDDTVDALTHGTGHLRDMSLAQVLQLDAGSHFAPEYASEHIPTLAQVLRLRPVGTWVNIEIKTELLDATPEQMALRATEGQPELVREPEGMVEQEARRVAQRTAEVVLALAREIPDLLAHLIVSSFHPVAIEVFAAHCPEVALAYLHSPDVYWNTEPLMRAMSHVHLSAVHLDKHEVSAERVAQAHAQGLKVNVWTVNDAALARSLFAIGVDGVFTNVPDVILRG